ncbi:MAG: aromatic amino acid lyase [Nocardioidaceae bacterium]
MTATPGIGPRIGPQIGPEILVTRPEDLDAQAVRAVADGSSLRLAPTLLAAVEADRERMLAALTDAGPVYGVSTGMGLQSGLAIGAADQPAYQNDLMLARAVGGAPWLDRRTTRAAVATRLRTLLDAETGISSGLVLALAAVLQADLHPAVPVDGNGAAGEIIPLAHLGGFLTGRGEAVGTDGTTASADEVLRDAGVAPYTFAAKEGVAFLQGVPVAASRAVLLGGDARRLAAQSLVAAAAEIALVRAPRDPYEAALTRGDDVLRNVHGSLRELLGEEPQPRMLQAPVSFRVVGPALAYLLRSVTTLEAAVDRCLSAVGTSPALVEGRFLGTAGFDGFDLAAALDGVRLAVLHAADLGVARLHRMLDARVTGLAPQLSAQPGRQAGLVAVHKRAVGVLHSALRSSAPASLGTRETSLGQEDVQSFALEAAHALEAALLVLADVTACELLGVHQASVLDPARPRGSQALRMVLHKAFQTLAEDANDRQFGRDVTELRRVLAVGWAGDVLDRRR